MIAHKPKPALRFLCTPDAAASTASRPASVTIASRPLMGRDSDRIRVIWVNRETIYFRTGDSTAFSRAKIFCLSGKSLAMKIDGAGQRCGPRLPELLSVAPLFAALFSTDLDQSSLENQRILDGAISRLQNLRSLLYAGNSSFNVL
jgi:hypothetical protein